MSDTNSTQFTADLELDTCGLRCPIPIMRTKQQFSKLDKKQTLLVITTDPSYAIDCQVFIRQTGHKLLQSWLEGDKFFYILQHRA